MYSEEQLQHLVVFWNNRAQKTVSLSTCRESLQKRLQPTVNAGYTAEQVEKVISEMFQQADSLISCDIYHAVSRRNIKQYLSQEPPADTQPQEPQPQEPQDSPADTQPQDATAQDATAQDATAQALGALFETVAGPIIDRRIENACRTGAIEKPIVLVTPTKKVDTTDKHEKFEQVFSALANHNNIFLVGPAGTGKNVIAEQCAQALDIKFYYDNAVMDEYKIKGFMDAGGRFIDTPFYHAFKDGGLYMLDELDCSAQCALKALNAALENGYYTFANGEQVKRSNNFYCIGAGNTYGTGASAEYTGALQQDASVLNRFVPVEIDYSRKIENSLAPADVVEFCRDFRQACKKCGIQHVTSYRNIKALYSLSQIWDSLQDAVHSAVVRELSQDDIEMIRPCLRHSDNRFAQAL